MPPLAPTAPPVGVGVLPPLATPCDRLGRPDPEALGRLIDRVVDGGVHGLFVLGTTGEGPAFGVEQRERVVHAALDANAGRVPVLVAATDSSLDGVLRVAEAAAAGGADALVIAPPPYHPVSAAELDRYLGVVAERTELPLFLYDMPSRTGAVPMASLRRAMDSDRFVGFKDSSGRMGTLQEAILHRDRDRPGFRLLVGPEQLLAEATLLGADGCVAGGANLFPGLYVALHAAAAAGELDTVRRLHRVVMLIASTLYCVSPDESAFVQAIKAGLAAQGVCEDHLLLPYARFEGGERGRFERLFAEATAAVRDALAGSGATSAAAAAATAATAATPEPLVLG